MRTEQHRRNQKVSEWSKKHDLTIQQAKRMGVRWVSKEEASRLLGHDAPAGGIYIPYFDVNGKPTKMFRIRFDDYPSFLPKPKRFSQATGSSIEAYFVPLCTWAKVLKDTAKPLLITEGEAKAAAANAHDMPCIGLGGVWIFGDKKHGRDLLPELEQFEWKDRDVYIVFDSDAATNPDVMRAENRLALVLVNRGARVHVVRLLQAADGSKMGVDDFILAHGAAKFKQLYEDTPEWGPSRDIYELNAKYGFIHNVAEVLEYPTPERPSPLFFSPKVFVDSVEAARRCCVNGNNKQVSAARLWIESKSRVEFKDLIYAPGADPVVNGCYNIWQRSPIEAKPGDCGLFMELVSHLFPDREERDWLLSWVAAPVQHPGERNNNAVVAWGAREGTGKSLLGTMIGELHGHTNYIEIGQTELQSRFNEWAGNKTFIMGSEVCGERDARAMADRLKTLITGDDITVNKKYQPTYVLRNCANYYFTSNHANAVFIGDQSRRFSVFHVDCDPLPAKFYASCWKWFKSGGASTVLNHLLSIDLSSYNPKAHALKTEAREEMIDANRTQVQSWVRELRLNTDTVLMLPGSLRTTTGAFFTTKQLLAFFDSTGQSKLTEKGMACALRAEGFIPANKGELIRIPDTDLRLRLWVVRDQLRAANMSPGQIGEAYAHDNKLDGKGRKYAR